MKQPWWLVKSTYFTESVVPTFVGPKTKRVDAWTCNLSTV